MNKLTSFLVCVFIVFSISSTYSNCTCGSFETGVYEFTIIPDSGGCCSGTPSSEIPGYYITYHYSEGAWEVENIDRISSAAGQRACCLDA